MGWPRSETLCPGNRVRYTMEVQATSILRVGGSVRLGSGTFPAVDVQVRQLDFGGDGGIWLSPVRRVQPLIGLRIGGGVLTQTAHWDDPGGWYDIQQAELPVHRSGQFRVLLDGGALWRPGKRLVLRATVAGGLALLPMEEGVRARGVCEVRVGLGGAL